MEKYDTIVSWKINDLCNFNCTYCQPKEKYRGGKHFTFDNIDEIVKIFDKTNLTWLVYLTGGEPFLQKDFIEFCKKITKKHYIALDTNLSTKNVYEFIEQINPERVDFINCSLHIYEREKQDSKENFINKYKSMKNAGFNIFVMQVIWPPVISDFNNIFKYFKKQGIHIYPRPFEGSFKNKEYPLSYSNNERKNMNKYFIETEDLNDSLGPIKTSLFIKTTKAFFQGPVSFKNSTCLAGYNFIRLNEQGDVLRCDSDEKIYGNIYSGGIKFLDKPTKCTSDYCVCPIEGFFHSQGKPKITTNNIFKKIIYFAKR